MLSKNVQELKEKTSYYALKNADQLLRGDWRARIFVWWFVYKRTDIEDII